MNNENHIPWPKHPDGSNMTLGEMSPEDRKAQIAAATRRFKARFDRDVAPAIQAVLKKHEML